MWTQRASLAHDVRGSLLDLGAAKTLVKYPDSQKVSRGRNTIAPQVNMPRTPAVKLPTQHATPNRSLQPYRRAGGDSVKVRLRPLGKVRLRKEKVRLREEKVRLRRGARSLTILLFYLLKP